MKVEYDVLFELINGVKIGIEHIDGDGIADDMEWMIAIDVLIFRIGILKYEIED